MTRDEGTAVKQHCDKCGWPLGFTWVSISTNPLNRVVKNYHPECVPVYPDDRAPSIPTEN